MSMGEMGVGGVHGQPPRGVASWMLNVAVPALGSAVHVNTTLTVPAKSHAVVEEVHVLDGTVSVSNCSHAPVKVDVVGDGQTSDPAITSVGVRPAMENVGACAPVPMATV